MIAMGMSSREASPSSDADAPTTPTGGSDEQEGPEGRPGRASHPVGAWAIPARDRDVASLARPRAQVNGERVPSGDQAPHVGLGK